MVASIHPANVVCDPGQAVRDPWIWSKALIHGSPHTRIWCTSTSLSSWAPCWLNLWLFCTPRTHAKDTLDIWLALPLLINGHISLSGTDDTIVALEQSYCVCEVNLKGLEDQQLDKVLAVMQVPSGCSQFVLGWICPSFAILLFVWHSISGIAKTTFVCYSTCLPLPLSYPPFQVYFTQGNGCSPLCVVQPQMTYPLIPIPLILPWLGKTTSMSASIKMFCHPCSQIFCFPRGYQIFRGPCDLHWHPSTQ